MTTERARQIETLYAEALERTGSERTAFLNKACSGDRELLREIESLLAQGTATGSFMESPAIEVVWPHSNSTSNRPKPATPPGRQCSVCSTVIAAGSRFCSACGKPADHASVPTAGAPPTGPTAPPTGQAAKQESEIWFTPGTILGGRYRIVAFLGRGGMGEVYRADDLTLGLPVALKFLPPALASDPTQRERFLAEVRITRQLSHPNICRVYDIAKSEGRYFLSMEYIDGEDLASLLKRIGYLPGEKALDVSRQLLAGLMTAHEHGILHRDLKPSNIMLDGRGRVRIMDFGLAIAAGEEVPKDQVLGTPFYMAPEQFAGKPATVLSDIYALGLVLYEVFCGKRALTATTFAELRLEKESQVPKTPSVWRSDIHPAIDRLIARCIERDPRQRPGSVRQLAAALPGGDPLAAALEAGETPAPEVVAAFGQKEGLRLPIAILLVLVFAAAVVAAIQMNPRTFLLQRVRAEKDPAVLLDRAREYVKQAGYITEAADSAKGFEYDSALMEYIRHTDKSSNRWDKLDAYRGVTFWYRQSPQELERMSAFGNTGGVAVKPHDPRPQFSGEVFVRVDMAGRLTGFDAIPDSVKAAGGPGKSVEWASMFTSAGLDISQWARVPPRWNPPYYADTLAAWEGVFAEAPGTPLRIEAAAYAGKPVHFVIIGPWTLPSRVPSVVLDTGIPISNPVLWVVVLVALGLAGLFARRNLRLGRGDRRGARRIAIVTAVMAHLSWAANEHHVRTTWELQLFLQTVSFVLLLAGGVWLVYMALEPLVRRRWPRVLVAWTRLFSGEWRDPLLGREVLIGCVTGAFVACIDRIQILIPSLLGGAEGLPIERSVGYAFVAGTPLRHLIDPLGFGILNGLTVLFLYVLMRSILRNDALAAGALILLLSIQSFPEFSWITAGLGLLKMGTALFVLMRFGLITAVAEQFVWMFFQNFPMTLGFSEWYSGIGFVALAFVGAFVLYGFLVSVRGQKLLDIDDAEPKLAAR
jgi:serine/threonine-protein kinase